MVDTIKLNPHHLTDVNTKEIVFSGGVNDYGAAQSGVDTIVCVAPHAMKLTSFTIRADTLNTTGGTVDVKKAASGTALSSGTDMVTQVAPTSATLTAATNYDMVVTATAADATVAAGDLVCLLIGSITQLTGLAYLAVFERV